MAFKKPPFAKPPMKAPEPDLGGPSPMTDMLKRVASVGKPAIAAAPPKMSGKAARC